MNPSTPIYFDYAATTPVDSRVAEAMFTCLTRDGNYANAASRTHKLGWKAEQLVETAREQVAQLIHADVREIVWTSGATESNNLAIKGIAQFYQKQGRHIITSSIEHKAVLDTCRFLEHHDFDVTYLNPNRQGIIDIADVENAIRDDTRLVTLMHVNNEIGSINDLVGIGKLCREHEIFFHVDAAQSPGKLAIDVDAMNIDAMSLSAHKVYGPKGIGALFIRRKPQVHVVAQMHGGGHERGMRSGTLPVHQIVGMGEAFQLAEQEREQEWARIKILHQSFLRGLQAMNTVGINGSLDQAVPHILNVNFGDIDGESLMMAIHTLAVSSGSACTSARIEPSYVLKALGLSADLAHNSLRFSFGRYTTDEEVEYAIEQLHNAISKFHK